MGRALRDGVENGERMKPIGAYDVTFGAPPFVSFGMLDPAAPLPAPRPGFGWVVQIGFHESPLEPAGVIAARVMRQLVDAGLWDQVLAFVYGEEWYSRFDQDHFAAYGLQAGHPQGISTIHAYLGRQHGEIVAVTGKPVLWVEVAVTADRQPPAHTAYVGIDAYVPDGQTFEASVGPVFLEAERATPLPLVVIARWFAYAGEKQGPGWRRFSGGPTPEMAAGYAAVLARPRWHALIGFLWGSRPSADLVGLADLPDTRDALVRSLGGLA